MRLYLPLIILCLVTSVRVYLGCFNGKLCNEKKEVQILNPDKFLGKLISEIRIKSTELARENFPSPHSELLLGMVIGINDIDKVPSFEWALKESGTIHVVVVSGFNISLVFGLIIGVLGSRYRLKNLLIAQSCTLFYTFLSGFEPPVIRAWVMGSIAAWAKYYGRSVDGFRLLMFSGLLMVLIDPYFLFSLSFQLSFLATLGLILYGEFFSSTLSKVSKSVLFEDLAATLSAQVTVWPLISFHFGTVSLVSPLVNMLSLWTVPIATILGTLFILLGTFLPFLSKILAILIYPFLDIFVRLNVFFSQFYFSSRGIQVDLIKLSIYYLFVAFWAIYLGGRRKKDYETK